MDDESSSVVGSNEHLGRSIESSGSTPGGGAEDKKGSRSSLGSWNFMRKKQKTPNSNRDLMASEISESGELASESGTTTDYEREEENASRPVSSATT